MTGLPREGLYLKGARDARPRGSGGWSGWLGAGGGVVLAWVGGWWWEERRRGGGWGRGLVRAGLCFGGVTCLCRFAVRADAVAVPCSLVMLVVALCAVAAPASCTCSKSCRTWPRTRSTTLSIGTFAHAVVGGRHGCQLIR